MKKIILIAALVLSQHGAMANEAGSLSDLFPGSVINPEFVINEGDPGPDALEIETLIHDKNIVMESSEFKIKWTELGYGAITEKVIIPELANHTVFNHRNNGEEGPCLRSYRMQGDDPIEEPQSLLVNIQIKNQYLINEEKRICKVSMVEVVSTEISGTVFEHVYSKDMGFRYINDCLKN